MQEIKEEELNEIINKIYKKEVIRTPSLNELRESSNKLGLHSTEEELKQYQTLSTEILKSFEFIDKFEVKSPLAPKYPRLPGYRPNTSENKLNGWYFKCEINGAADGKLKGKTLAVKDNISVASVPMMNGSRFLQGFVPIVDATVVTRCLDEGVIIKGKSCCEDLCLSGSSFTSGLGAVLNPVKLNHAAGGSSSGSAALVAAGEVDLALTCDQGGSSRIPCAFCGVVGIKPTRGLVPYTGIFAMERTLDHCGVCAKTVEEAALLLEVVAGRDSFLDPRQPFDLKKPENYSSLFSIPLTPSYLKGMKIGILKEGFDHQNSSKEVDQLILSTAIQLENFGAKVSFISNSLHLNGIDIWNAIGIYGIYDLLVKGNSQGSNFIGYYDQELFSTVFDHFLNENRTSQISDTNKLVFLLGDYIDKIGAAKYYAKAQNISSHFSQSYSNLFRKEGEEEGEGEEGVDVIVMPTVPIAAHKLPLKEDYSAEKGVRKGLEMIANTAPFNITGHPAITVNAGFSDGLPVGFMAVGRHWDENSIIQIARAVESLRLSPFPFSKEKYDSI